MRKALSLLIVSLGLAVGSFAQTTATFPKVVAVFHRCNQTDTIPTAPIFTPKAGGLFRFTIYGEILKAASDKDAYWSDTFTFTNHVGEETFNFVMPASPVTTSLFGSTIWDREGFPISVGVNSVGDVSGSEYNITIVVEELMSAD
jgi:hypothetical protein